MLFIMFYNMPIFKDRKEAAIADTLIKNRMAETERNRAAELRKLKDRDPNRLLSTMLAERYLIVEKIGEGGMGTVYLAEDAKIGGKVAIKVLPKYLSRAPQVVERFVQEARVSPRIEHENIVKVTDLGTTLEGVPFFVMEHLRGKDLYQEISGGTMGWNRRTADIILQVCRALSAAHDKDIIHRDMKPENIFLVEHSDGKPFVKLVDFGIAKLLEQQALLEEKPDGNIIIGNGSSRITQAGMVLGTPSYMAPEQARGGAIDHRVDIYAVGTILYEMVCGGVPFDPEGFEGMQRAQMILEMQKQAEPLPPSKKRPDLKFPQELEALIMRCLKKNPDERFATMAEMEKAIAAIEAPEPQVTRVRNGGIRPGSRSALGYMEMQRAEGERRTRRRLKLVAAVVAATLAGGAAYKLVPEAIEYFHSQDAHMQKK